MPLNQFNAENVRPINRKWFNNEPPYFQEHITIGVEGNRYTVIKVWVRKPNPQFPDAKVFFSVSNGKSSTFSRLSDSSELVQLADWLKKAAKGADKAILELAPAVEAAKQNSDEFNRVQQQILSMIENQPELLEDEEN